MSPPGSWLAARPIAHRGLHDDSHGLIENSIGAARAAIAAGYAIECDVQLTRDGELVVFHDDTLERLTARDGKVADHDARELIATPLWGTNETIPTLSAFLGEVAGRAILVVEIKSVFDGSTAAAKRAAELLAHYDGLAVIESFDPVAIAFLRAHAAMLGVAHIPLGIVAQASYEGEEWAFLSPAQRQELTHFLHYRGTSPDFISWNVADLPHAIPFLARQALRIPVTTWTVRTREQAEAARQWADQIVFEGFSPHI